jgi:hypothetical protein
MQRKSLISNNRYVGGMKQSASNQMWRRIGVKHENCGA